MDRYQRETKKVREKEKEESQLTMRVREGEKITIWKEKLRYS